MNAISKDLAAALAAMDSREAPAAVLGWREIGRLALRTWPFIRPLWGHVVAVLLLGAASGIFLAVLGLLATDLLMNKVLVGEKLQPAQVFLLGLDDSYLADPLTDPDEAAGDAAAEAEDAAPAMTQEQRRVVRNRLVVWLGIGALVVLGGIATIPYYQTWVRQQINQRLRVAMIERAEHLSLKFHSHARVGDAVFRVYQDSAMIVNLVEEALVGPLVMLYALVAGLALTVFFSLEVALACVVAAVPMVWATVRWTPRIRRRARANRTAGSNLTSRLQETFLAVKVVKANRAEHRLLDRFAEDSTRALDAAFYFRLEMVLLSAVVMMIGGATLIGAEYAIADWTIAGEETYLGALAAGLFGFALWNVGAFIAARDSVTETAGTGYGMVRVWCMLQDLFIGLKRAFFLLDLEPDVVDPPSPVVFPAPLRRIVCEDLRFGYEDGAAPVLDGLNLTAEAGTVTAVVGASGAGKSTLMSLLLRLYDPDQGRVTFNGVDLKELRVDDVRAHTAIALQKNVLFPASVAGNIGYGSATATRQRIEAAARIACADEFIADMANGYDTELGERGGKLSTGQRQRLSIARALVRDAALLILDEPTSALDAGTEERLLANLSAWSRTPTGADSSDGAGRVVLLVTHRLSTVRRADRVAFLASGRIVEFGTHEDLVAIEGGAYRAFVAADADGPASSPP